MAQNMEFSFDKYQKRDGFMKRIMFVCHGNICRSPMAEFIMRDLLLRRGLSDKISVLSSATSTEEIGNPIYPPVKRILSSLGIDASAKRAVQLARADYARYDLFVGMDSANIRNMNRIVVNHHQLIRYLHVHFVL